MFSVSGSVWLMWPGSGLTISSFFHLLLRKPQALPPSLVLSQDSLRAPCVLLPHVLPQQAVPEPRSGPRTEDIQGSEILRTRGNDGYVSPSPSPTSAECGSPPKTSTLLLLEVRLHAGRGWSVLSCCMPSAWHSTHTG